MGWLRLKAWSRWHKQSWRIVPFIAFQVLWVACAHQPVSLFMPTLTPVTESSDTWAVPRWRWEIGTKLVSRRQVTAVDLRTGEQATKQVLYSSEAVDRTGKGLVRVVVRADGLEHGTYLLDQDGEVRDWIKTGSPPADQSILDDIEATRMWMELLTSKSPFRVGAVQPFERAGAVGGESYSLVGHLILRRFWLLKGTLAAEIWTEMKSRGPGGVDVRLSGTQYYDAQRGIPLFTDLTMDVTPPTRAQTIRVRYLEVLEEVTQR